MPVVESFERFYRQHYSLILSVAHQRLGVFGDAEDATAETFRIAWDYYQCGNELTLAWTYQVLRNVIGNQYRSRRRREALKVKIAQLEIEPTGEFASLAEDRIAILKAMTELSEPEQELLRMAYWEDFSGKEIAEILNCSPTAARIRLTRARKHLLAILAADKELEGCESNGRV
jgi:RNA polymerase sigma factor (sigma-70 family)